MGESNDRGREQVYLSIENTCWGCLADLSQTPVGMYESKECPQCHLLIPVTSLEPAFVAEPLDWMLPLLMPDKSMKQPLYEEDLRRAIFIQYWLRPCELKCEQVSAALGALLKVAKKIVYYPLLQPNQEHRIAYERLKFVDSKFWQDKHETFKKDSTESALPAFFCVTENDRVIWQCFYPEAQSKERFDAAARLISAEAGLPGGDRSIFFWLDVLRLQSWRYSARDVENRSATTIFGVRYCKGHIPNIHSLAATHCLTLMAAARERERNEISESMSRGQLAQQNDARCRLEADSAADQLDTTARDRRALFEEYKALQASKWPEHKITLNLIAEAFDVKDPGRIQAWKQNKPDRLKNSDGFDQQMRAKLKHDLSPEFMATVPKKK